MKEEIKRPQIKEYFGQDATLTQVMKTYHSAPELFNYAQALDRYIDELEDSTIPATEAKEQGGGEICLRPQITSI